MLQFPCRNLVMRIWQARKSAIVICPLVKSKLPEMRLQRKNLPDATSGQ
jgi:hypothetical protein